MIKNAVERFELSNKPTLIITKKLQNQINYLHAKVGSKEWSGELITTEKGVITDLDKWEITGHEIYLNDVDSYSYTSYEVDQKAWKPVDIVELFKKYPGLLEGEQKRQHIHTH